MWSQLFYLLGTALAGWVIYRVVKGNPQLFSKENLNKSFYTMALLALGLIGFMASVIVLLRSK